MVFLVSPAASVLGSVAWLGQGTPRQLNDDIVRPGWIGFGVFIALAVASYFLFRSMNRQLKKVDFEEEPLEAPVADATDTPAPTDDAPPTR